MAHFNIHAQLAYYGSAMTEVFFNTNTGENWDWDAWKRYYYIPSHPKNERSAKEERVISFLHKVAYKRNLFTHYDRIMDNASKQQLTDDQLPGYIYLSKRIHKDPAFYKILRVCALDPEKKALKYRNQSTTVTSVYRTEDPLYNLAHLIKETTFQTLIESDRKFVLELKAYLTELNARGASKNLLPCSDQPRDKAKRKSNIAKCLQIITETGLPEPNLSAFQQQRADTIAKIMSSFVYTQTTSFAKPDLPSKIKFNSQK